MSILYSSRLLILGVASVLSVLGISCDSSQSEVTDPRTKIIQVTARNSLNDGTYTIFIDCTVKNEGASGSILVSAELKSGEREQTATNRFYRRGRFLHGDVFVPRSDAI
jgi:hypothetical protein